MIVQRCVGRVGCAGLVDGAVRGARVAGNSSIALRVCGFVRSVVTGRSVSAIVGSVTAIGGRGFVALLQSLLELLGLLVVLGFCGVGFADGSGSVGGAAQRFRRGNFRLVQFGKLVEIVGPVEAGERFGDLRLQLERLGIGGVLAVTASLQSLSAARSRICCDARTPVNPKTAPRTTTTTTTAMMIWR